MKTISETKACLFVQAAIASVDRAAKSMHGAQEFEKDADCFHAVDRAKEILTTILARLAVEQEMRSTLIRVWQVIVLRNLRSLIGHTPAHIPAVVANAHLNLMAAQVMLSRAARCCLNGNLQQAWPGIVRSLGDGIMAVGTAMDICVYREHSELDPYRRPWPPIDREADLGSLTRMDIQHVLDRVAAALALIQTVEDQAGMLASLETGKNLADSCRRSRAKIHAIMTEKFLPLWPGLVMNEEKAAEPISDLRAICATAQDMMLAAREIISKKGGPGARIVLGRGLLNCDHAIRFGPSSLLDEKD